MPRATPALPITFKYCHAGMLPGSCPTWPKAGSALLCVLWVSLVHYLCDIKARVHVPVITMCCACGILNTAMFSTVPSCTPGILLGISCFPASHIILLPPTCRHICKANKTKLCFMKIHTEGSCPSPLHSYLWVQTPHTEGFWTPQHEDQYSQPSTEDAGNTFSWHNGLTTLCLSMYKTYLCLCVLPQSWRRHLPPSKVQDLCSWWYNAQQNLQEHYQGKHCLWPGDCRDYKLKTQLQFYHCCYHLAAKAEQKEKVYLGGVQHADTTNLDLWIIPQKTSDRLKKFLYYWLRKIPWVKQPWGKIYPRAKGQQAEVNKPTIKIKF